MVLNDCFDRDVDARERPQRPLPSGAVPIETAWRLGLSLLVTGVVLAGFAGRQSLMIAAVLAATILGYNGALKSTWAGPLLMGFCRYLNWLLGLSVTALGVSHWMLPLPVLVYVAALTVLSRSEAGGADRRSTVLAASGLVIAGLSIFALWRDEVLAGPAVVPLTAAALAAALYVVARSERAGSPGAVQRAVGLLILGMIPLDVLLVLGRGIWWGLGLLLLMLPGRWLGRRLYVT
jgi:4-hydroxybenzoate polyprenyltransferase